MAKVRFNLQARLEKQQNKGSTAPSELRRAPALTAADKENTLRADYRSPTGMPTRRLPLVEQPNYQLGGRGYTISFDKRRK